MEPGWAKWAQGWAWSAEGNEQLQHPENTPVRAAN